jgi:hypothetical protein
MTWPFLAFFNIVQVILLLDQIGQNKIKQILKIVIIFQKFHSKIGFRFGFFIYMNLTFSDYLWLNLVF